MDEYIKKQELLDQICRENCNHLYNGMCHNCRITEIVAEFTPSSDVRPVVRGEWAEHTKTAYGPVGKNGNLIEREVKTYCCKKCGRETVIKENFCPDCGADMRGE